MYLQLIWTQTAAAKPASSVYLHVEKSIIFVFGCGFGFTKKQKTEMFDKSLFILKDQHLISFSMACCSHG